MALDYLGEVIAKLNDNPGLFENYQKKLRDMFVELVDNHFVMSNVIENIFEQVYKTNLLVISLKIDVINFSSR